MATEMEQVVDQMRQMQAVSEQLALQMQAMRAENIELVGRVQGAEAAAASGGGGGGHGGGFASLSSKWAPSDFSGEHSEWRDWNIKFKSYMGANAAACNSHVWRSAPEPWRPYKRLGREPSLGHSDGNGVFHR
jgi:hypothetical protein